MIYFSWLLPFWWHNRAVITEPSSVSPLSSTSICPHAQFLDTLMWKSRARGHLNDRLPWVIFFSNGRNELSSLWGIKYVIKPITGLIEESLFCYFPPWSFCPKVTIVPPDHWVYLWSRVWKMTGCLRGEAADLIGEERAVQVLVPVTLVDTVGNSAKNHDGSSLS